MPVTSADKTAPEFAILGLRSNRNLPKPRASQRWYVLAVKGQQEKALASDLLERRVTYYLPMTGAEALSGGRHVPVMRPLFPGYLFCYADPLRFQQLVLTGEPAKRLFDKLYVQDGGQGQLIEELEVLRKVNTFYQPAPSIDYAQYKPGRRCEFLQPEGLRGTRTTIAEVRKSKDTYIAQVPVSLLGGVPYEVPCDHLRLL